ncbi:hypothetical protein WBG99_07850 [Streptomyces sp. TG1A-60]|uniref:hypothetical protein n=1 Tax=Streptomyces sp. TG1A-60 TaxID=3129111 RepID=UPI0030D0A4F7
MHGHLPWPWGQLCAVAGRRRGREVGPLFSQLIATNPFHGWAVEGRYCDETSITEADLARRLATMAVSLPAPPADGPLPAASRPAA